MRNLSVNSADARLLEAVTKVESMGYDELKLTAATSDDDAILQVLANSEYSEVVRRIIENPHAPPAALRKLLQREGEFESSDIMESIVFELAKHPKIDAKTQEDLSKHQNWEIRYLIVARDDAPEAVLRKLAKDGHLAVKAKAAMQLGLTPVDEEFGLMEMSCVQLNEHFEKIKDVTKTQQEAADETAKQLGMGEEDYNSFESFTRDCWKALADLKKQIINHYAALLKKRYLPNIEFQTERIAKLMEKLGKHYFDAYIIAAEAEALIANRAQLSFEEILSKARYLLPYMGNPSTGSWGPASTPYLILKGSRLQLRAYVDVSSTLSYAHVTSEYIEALEALDKISKIVILDSDPSGVQSHIVGLLCNRRTPQEVFTKIPVGGVIVSIRFFKNGRLDVQYKSEEDARKVAEVLTGQPLNPTLRKHTRGSPHA